MSTKSPLTTASIEAAEALFGISYTPAERALMLDNLEPQIAMAQARRALALPGGLPPATRFDPRLPGFIMPTASGFAWQPREAPLPAHDDDIAFAPLGALAHWVKAQQITCLRLTNIYLDRIARFGAALNGFAMVTADFARKRAAELDDMLARGIWLGPLHGIPYGMKDLIDTAGITTGWGAEPYQTRTPETDAPITQSLHEAGAILLGKTTLGALAYGDLWYGGRTRNPWNLDEGSSGSSAGSACVTAAGLAAFAIGTETLGSIISPSTRCGTTGLRPSFGRVSRSGAMALCWSLDKIGPICRSVEDTALVLNAIIVPDAADPCQITAPFTFNSFAPIAGLRLGYFEADFADPETLTTDRDMLALAAELGLTLVPLSRPDLPYDSLISLLMAEAAAAFEDLTLSNRDDELTWQDDDAWPNSFRKARFLSAVDHIQLDRLRRLIMQEMDRLFQQVDVIIGPSLVGPMLTITNFTGHPSLCLPTSLIGTPTRPPVSLTRNLAPDNDTGAKTHNVPHSISLWGRLYEEGPMLNIGQALEARLNFAAGRPPGFSCAPVTC
ncbi:MAG: amidase [Acidocella sp.]|nr:amidase [Acidocella sp.]